MPLGGITATLLRKIPLAKILGTVDEDRAHEGHVAAPSVSAKEGRRRGPMPLSDDWIRIVAAAYVLGFMTKPGAPLQGAVAALGEVYPYRTVREHVQRARDKGFLAPTRRGKPQLELGPRWREVILLGNETLPTEIRSEGSSPRIADWLQSMFEGILSCSNEKTASKRLKELALARE
jgi:hypothetical protein